MAPRPDSTAAVEEWLYFHGINTSSAQRSDAGDWIKLQVSIDQAERMLGTRYNIYQHGPSGEQVVRTLSCSLPKELHSHIDIVTPTTYFGTPRSMKKAHFLQPDEQAAAALRSGSDAAVPSSCANTITPTCLRDLYNTSTYIPTQTKVNKLGVAGYLDEFTSAADLQVNYDAFLNHSTLPSKFLLLVRRLSSISSAQMLSAPLSLSSKLMEEEMIKLIRAWRYTINYSCKARHICSDCLILGQSRYSVHDWNLLPDSEYLLQVDHRKNFQERRF